MSDSENCCVESCYKSSSWHDIYMAKGKQSIKICDSHYLALWLMGQIRFFTAFEVKTQHVSLKNSIILKRSSIGSSKLEK